MVWKCANARGCLLACCADFNLMRKLEDRIGLGKCDRNVALQ